MGELRVIAPVLGRSLPLARAASARGGAASITEA